LEEARAVIEALEKERMWLRDLVVKVSEGSYILLPKAIDLNKVVEDNSLKERSASTEGFSRQN
jgi:hypothetical protein